MEGKSNSIKDKLNMRRFGKRPLVFALIFMIFGILIGTLCLKSMAGRISCIVILTVLVVLLFILKRTRKFAYLSLMFLVGWLWIVGSCDIYNSKTIESGSFALSGKVKSEISVGDRVEFGGLLGYAPVMRVNPVSCEKFIARGGRIPAPIHSLKN